MRVLASIWTLGLLACTTTFTRPGPGASEHPSELELGRALADNKGPHTFCSLNPEGCAGTSAPAAQDKATCKAICWENYDHNKEYCEELRHDPAAFRRCVISAGLLLSGCLATCEALSSAEEASFIPRTER